uniref:Uncharacterized protein n=1 Tax=Anopheles coluzzii TaxID=1518534 RepID=A0A8W7PVY4_ANOCL
MEKASDFGSEDCRNVVAGSSKLHSLLKLEKRFLKQFLLYFNLYQPGMTVQEMRDMKIALEDSLNAPGTISQLSDLHVSSIMSGVWLVISANTFSKMELYARPMSAIVSCWNFSFSSNISSDTCLDQSWLMAL